MNDKRIERLVRRPLLLGSMLGVVLSLPIFTVG